MSWKRALRTRHTRAINVKSEVHVGRRQEQRQTTQRATPRTRREERLSRPGASDRWERIKRARVRARDRAVITGPALPRSPTSTASVQRAPLLSHPLHYSHSKPRRQKEAAQLSSIYRTSVADDTRGPSSLEFLACPRLRSAPCSYGSALLVVSSYCETDPLTLFTSSAASCHLALSPYPQRACAGPPRLPRNASAAANLN